MNTKSVKMDYMEPLTHLSAKHEKCLKKFSKRKDKEVKSNIENKDFEFVKASSNYWYFRFTVLDGPYKDQTHIVEMKLVYGVHPDVFIYPNNAPLCKFITNIWHPNISNKGTICLDILKDEWSATITTSNIINSITLLLLNPDISSPLNRTAADMFDDNNTYTKKIKSCYTDTKNIENYTKLFD